MTGDHFTIELSRDEALVLSDWLNRMMGTSAFDNMVDQDREVWSPLYRIAGTLETSLTEIFSADYATHLQVAKQRLLEALGEAGRTPPSSPDVGWLCCIGRWQNRGRLER